MKTNNRPMVKEIKDIDMGYAGREVIEVERPMNEAEYIEYLEEQVSDTFGKLVSVEELSKQTISTLEKENQELKDRLKEVAPILKEYLGGFHHSCGCAEMAVYRDDVYIGMQKQLCVEHGGFDWFTLPSLIDMLKKGAK